MKQKIIKRLLIILALVMIIVVAYELIRTYAIFYSEANGTVSVAGAIWSIHLNNTDISSGTETNFTVNNIELTTSEHILEGKIAPSINGIFYIEIDPGNTNVSVRYDITLDKSNISNGIAIDSITEVNENYALIQTAEDTYTGIISLSKIQQATKHKVAVSIEWSNNEENNASDTAIGIVANTNLNLPITVNTSQYLGDEIIPYNG